MNSWLDLELGIGWNKNVSLTLLIPPFCMYASSMAAGHASDAVLVMTNQFPDGVGWLCCEGSV